MTWDTGTDMTANGTIRMRERTPAHVNRLLFSRGQSPRTLQIYETTVLHPDPEKDLSWRFVVVPAHSLHEDRIDVSTTVQKLELTTERTIELSLLPFVMAAMLVPTPGDDVLSSAQNLYQSLMSGTDPFVSETSEALRFAEQLAFQRLVPFEQSPLSNESLAGIASLANDGTGVTLVKHGDGNLVLAASSAGFVISGPSQWLSASILERIFDWLRGK